MLNIILEYIRAMMPILIPAVAGIIIIYYLFKDEEKEAQNANDKN